MYVTHLSIYNFCRFRGQHSLSLETGTISIVAEQNGDPSCSNGSGKTTILSAIAFALYGHNEPKSLVTWGEVSMRVELHLSTGHVFVRGVEHGRGFAEATGLEGARSVDINRFAEEQVGLNEAAFRSTCALLRGDHGRIALAGQAERRDMLADWVVPPIWAEAYERARALLKQVEQERALIQAELDVLKTHANDLIRLKREREDFEAVLAALPPLINPDDVAEAVRAAEVFRQWKDASTKAEKIQNYLEQLPSIEFPDSTAVEKARRSVVQGQERLKELEKLCRGSFDGNCPLDHEVCPRAEEIRTNRDKHEEAKRKGIPWVENKEQELEKLKEQQRMAERAQQEKEKLQANLSALGELVKPPSVTEHQREILMNRPNPAERTRLERQLGALDERIARAIESQEQAKQLGDTLVQVEKKYTAYVWLSRAVGRNGVPSMLVDYAAGSIAADASAILETAGSSLRIEAKLAQELARPAERCACGYVFPARAKKCASCSQIRRNAISPDLSFVVARGEETPVDLSQRSSGEQAIVAVALRLAAASARRRVSGSPFSTLLLDEADANLDAENSSVLAELSRRCASSLGFEQVMVSSHRPDVRLSADRVVKIIRDEEGSRIS